MPNSALARHPVSLAGAALASASVVAFIGLFVAELLGLFTNPYAALVVFVAVPALLVIGLLLIPLGMWLERRRLRRHPGAEREWFVIDFRSPVTRRRAEATQRLQKRLTVLSEHGTKITGFLDEGTRELLQAKFLTEHFIQTLKGQQALIFRQPLGANTPALNPQAEFSRAASVISSAASCP